MKKSQLKFLSSLVVLAILLVQLFLQNTASPSVISPTPVIRSVTAAPFDKTLGATTSAQFVVTRVVDGDTIVVNKTTTVRLIGINTPETVDPRRPLQCFGKEASDKAKELLLNKTVQLEKDISETDRYGRLLRYVYIGEQMINEQLVREGYAQAVSYPPDVKHLAQLKAAENDARMNKKGLWGVCPSGP